MKITKHKTKLRQVAYSVELSEYDAEPPSKSWVFDDLPWRVNPELEALALYMIFGPWCGGEFTVPQKFGPNTASLIAQHSGIAMFPGPIEFYPKALPLGTGLTHVSDSIRDIGPNSLVCLDSSEWNGSLRSTSSLVVASNTGFFRTSERDVRPLIAAAILLAGELDARTLKILPAFEAQLEPFQMLSSAAGLSLEGGSVS
ncbi:hypothetical protein GCM10009631_23400 [Corynebacterium glaucum]|uniref:hypothetical protein n=1 Tax=Corynebacterium glaucum TaxID=187491 RepID=UPI000BAC1EC1|nr:hypothetical protein [Corynebacterium glaucum]